MTDKEIVENAQAVPDDVDAYNALVHEAELTDIRLVDLNFKATPDYFAALRDEAEGKKMLNRAFDGAISDLFYDKEIRTLGGQFDWSTQVKSGNKKLLRVEARFLVVYGNVPEVAEETQNRYIQRVGRFATYPYFRALVSQLSWESRAELPIMPVLK